MSVDKFEMKYILDNRTYIVIKKTENSKEHWWKTKPLEFGIGSSFHFMNRFDWIDHFDKYENGRKVGKMDVRIDKGGKTWLSSEYENKFKKTEGAEIFICPDPDENISKLTPKIDTVDLGSEFIIKTDQVIPIVWASTSGDLISFH